MGTVHGPCKVQPEQLRSTWRIGRSKMANALKYGFVRCSVQPARGAHVRTWYALCCAWRGGPGRHARAP